MNIIENSWLSYKKRVVPKDASETQIRETRIAFYAGVVTVWTLFEKLDYSTGEPTKEDLQMLDSVDKEVKDFLATTRPKKH